MATFTKKSTFPVRVTGAPYGNLVALDGYRLETNASGVVLSSDAGAAPLATSDVVRLGLLPAGTRLLDYQGTISDAFTASSTFSLGFAYVDGVDNTAAPQDAAYFASGTSLAATGVFRKATVTLPVTLPKDAWLILTNAGANQAAVGIAEFVIYGSVVGVSN
jgi:hypothetical protein